jgi:hypothetical protein
MKKTDYGKNYVEDMCIYDMVSKTHETIGVDAEFYAKHKSNIEQIVRTADNMIKRGKCDPCAVANELSGLLLLYSETFGNLALKYRAIEKLHLEAKKLLGKRYNYE